MTIHSLRRFKNGLSRVFGFASRLLAAPSPQTPTRSHPADFDRWVGRRSARLRPSIPQPWLGTFERIENPTKIAVLLHVYYRDLVDEILVELQNVPVAFDLIVTNATDQPLELDTSKLALLGKSVIVDVDNCGRDILPMISVVNSGLLDPYEVILKIHTKKSEWRLNHPELSGNGDSWRQGFLAGLLGSPENVESILSEFAENPALGLLTTDGNVLSTEFWGGNRERARELLLRLQLHLNDESLTFAAGSIYWVRGFLLQGLRALSVNAEDFESEAGQIDGTTAHAIERILGILTTEAGYLTRERAEIVNSGGSSWAHYSPSETRRPRARALAFYLPQFHTFPENDAWWGEGFTEWSNVSAAQPVFQGQNQPLLPAELGFYDLANPEVRTHQYEIARSAGLEGFMYYYYWFAGKKLMNRPIEGHLSGTNDEPFCIMWANENWTRRWDGGEQNVLIAQDYDAVPATQFIHDVLPLLLDPRYIRIDDKPVIAVYRITQIPDYVDVLNYWRTVAIEAGLGGLNIVTVDVGRSMDGIEGNLSEHGVDAFLEFAPHNRPWTAQDRNSLSVDPRFEGNILSYAAMASDSELHLREPVAEYRYPGMLVNFDNTARRQWQPDLWYGSNPYTFRRWFNSMVSAVADRNWDRRVVFVNAWNEWAEGAVLEPSQRFGRTYLLAVRDVLYR
ncbi:glycosyl transferase family 2 [Cryobacterium glaciale]|uniref:Glycosyl transferase family 2 n=1 Tax=Cryobacterium glaciale TaxID=1259145 RepID=A0A4R8UXT9_9MICO|nr:glycoside hydrolase family 99-like domain-containing protein [Cryobacterium glaciale]TFB74342.1 glycosyl transferase family 2 [Cryobacterium glaciale]